MASFAARRSPWLLAALLGCAAPAPHGKGGDCHSLSDCKAGLACIEGRCSTDLESIEGTVPDYGGDAQVAASDAGTGEAPGTGGDGGSRGMGGGGNGGGGNGGGGGPGSN